MWIKKLKKKKIQYVVIGLIFMCITSIFTGCISFAFGMKEFSSSFYANASNPEYYYASIGEEGIDELKNYAKSSGEIKDLNIMKGKSLNTDIKVNGKNIPLFQSGFYAMEDAGDMPFFFEGKGAIAGMKQPASGTVWISDVFADVKGVKVGEVLKVTGQSKEYEYKIAGTYLASICPSTSLAYYPFYLNPADIKDITDAPETYFSTMDKTDKKLDSNQFRTKLPSVFLNSVSIQYDLAALEMSLSQVTILMSGIGSMASLLIFLVSIIIIRFIIKSNMAREYKSIGVYKSLGFTSEKIMGFYFNCYLFTGFLGIGLGALLGLPLTSYLGRISIRYLGDYHIGTSALESMGTGALFFVIILTLNVYLALRKIKKISPVTALTMEMTSSRSKLKKSLIPNAHSPLSMAVNDIFKKKGQSFLILLILTIAFYLSIFFSMTNYTIRNIETNSADWFAIPNTKCFVSMELDKESQKIIKDSKYIKDVTFGQVILFIPAKMGYGENTIADCSFYSYSDFSESITGIKYREGRAPKGTNEIAVSSLSLKNMNVKPGDYVTLDLDGQKKEFLISGQYDSMMNGGAGIQIPNEALDKYGIAYKNNIGFVKLKNPSDYRAFQKEIERKLPQAKVTRNLEMLQDATKNVSDLVVPITTILVIIFMGFSFLNIVNLMLINNIDNRRKFGILKAMGFTNSYIVWQSTYKIMLLTAGAVAAAIGVHLSFSRGFFQQVIPIDGLLSSGPLIAGLMAVMILLVLITALLFTIPLIKIRPVDLMEE